jgi:CRP-like cAMP-binding protein
MVSDIFSAMSDDQRRRAEGLVDTLGRFSLFRAMDEQELRRILPEIKGGDFEPGTVIVRKGEQGRYLYIIESGSVEMVAGPGDEMVLTELRPGEIFGEMSLLSGTPSSATVRVRERSRLLAIDGERFTKLVTAYPSLQNYLFRLLSYRLRESSELRETRFSKGIRGTLDDLQLAELLQMLHTSHKSGQLSLHFPGGEAMVSMRDGNLVAIQYQEHTDEEGFFELLKQTEGSFSFTPVLPPEFAKRPEIGDFMQLLMEGFVRLDEDTRSARAERAANATESSSDISGP